MPSSAVADSARQRSRRSAAHTAAVDVESGFNPQGECVYRRHPWRLVDTLRISHCRVRGRRCVPAALVLILGACTHRTPQNPPMCPLSAPSHSSDPLGGLAEHQPIDDHCGINGIGSGNSVAQNRVKNDFCASAPLTAVDFAALQTLQDDVPTLGIAFPDTCRPAQAPTPGHRPWDHRR